MVYYDDGNDANNIDVVNFQGNDANFANAFDPPGWDITLDGINYTSGDAFLSMSVSDGQDFGLGNDGQFFLNGVDIAAMFDGSIFEGDSVPNTPGSTVGNGGLWDIVNIDITSFLTPGLNTLNLTHTGISDAGGFGARSRSRTRARTRHTGPVGCRPARPWSKYPGSSQKTRLESANTSTYKRTRPGGGFFVPAKGSASLTSRYSVQPAAASIGGPKYWGHTSKQTRMISEIHLCERPLRGKADKPGP